MDTLDIERIVNSDEYLLEMFGGVYPRDIFLNQFDHNPNKIYIFNTHDQYKTGQHWILVSGINPKRIEYFDSYGLSFTTWKDVEESLTKDGRSIVWNETTLQGMTTSVCGDYCMMLALLLARNWTLQRFVKRLIRIKSSEDRDHVVRNLMVSLYGNFLDKMDHNILGGYNGTHIISITPKSILSHET